VGMFQLGWETVPSPVKEGGAIFGESCNTGGASAQRGESGYPSPRGDGRGLGLFPENSTGQGRIRVMPPVWKRGDLS
jgi:hypothetical protein